MTTFRTYSLVAAIALCTASLPLVAHATDHSEVTVSTADLDLTTAGGVVALKQRIHGAAKTVCINVYPQQSVSSDVVRECRIEAAHQAQAAVQSAVRLAAASQATSVEAFAVPR